VPAIKIKAFTFEFNQFQDRIRLGGNLYCAEEEVSFWLTRRLAMRLLDAAAELVKKTSANISKVPFEHKEAMAQFEHQSAAFDETSTVEKTSSMNSEKTENIDICILHRLDISYKNERYKLNFFVAGKDQPVATSVIGSGQLHQILSLIHTGALELEWGVADNLFSDSLASSEYLLQ